MNDSYNSITLVNHNTYGAAWVVRIPNEWLLWAGSFNESKNIQRDPSSPIIEEMSPMSRFLLRIKKYTRLTVNI